LLLAKEISALRNGFDVVLAFLIKELKEAAAGV
jgi:hypothetical protein